MEDKVEEGSISGSLDSIPVEKMEKILEQMKKCICKVTANQNGTGFFCKIPYKGQLLPSLVTNYHILDDNFLRNNNQLVLLINNNRKIININKNSKIFSSEREKYDIMIIKLQEGEINNFLELDYDIFINNSENSFKNNSIYTLHYPNWDKPSVSFGNGLEKRNNYDIKHLCNTNLCSSGGPILNLSTNKVIAIHKGFIKTKMYNIGTFLKFPLIDSTPMVKEKKNNEIQMKIQIRPDDINQNLYFLCNPNSVSNYYDYLKEIKESNTEIFINENRYQFLKYLNWKIPGTHSIKLKFKNNITDCSYMFAYCTQLIDIDLSSFDSRGVINMESMFRGCKNLRNLDLSSFDSRNVKNMGSMFRDCYNLKSINLTSFDTKNVINMYDMFGNCAKLKDIDLSSFDIKNVTNMSCMFFSCINLTDIDISNFNFQNAKNIDAMFGSCDHLKRVKINKTAYGKIKEQLLSIEGIQIIFS